MVAMTALLAGCPRACSNAQSGDVHSGLRPSALDQHHDVTRGAVDDSPARPPPPTIPTLPAAIDAASADVGGQANRVEDLGGIRVTFQASGRVSVAGADPWGGRLDTEFESVAFFRRAVPTLTRSMTPEQGVALRRVAGP